MYVSSKYFTILKSLLALFAAISMIMWHQVSGVNIFFLSKKQVAGETRLEVFITCLCNSPSIGKLSYECGLWKKVLNKI